MYDSNNFNNIDECQKFPGETFFAEFQFTVSKNKRTFIKKAVLHTTIHSTYNLNALQS